MNKDQLIREYQNRRGTLPAILGLYGIIVCTMVLTGMAIT
jgi:hypothetical protein